MNRRKPGPWPGALNTGMARPQRGLSLIIVMLILIVVSVLGIGGIRISMMAERGTRNDRDLQIAWQAAEAGLVDAQFDIDGRSMGSVANRGDIFKRSNVDLSKFIADCGAADQSKGLCSLKTSGKPAWLEKADYAGGSNTVPFGAFTGRSFLAGKKGTQPAKPPRYVIEPMLDRYGAKSYRTTDPNSNDPPSYVFRVTTMGFGPNEETQAVLQMVYRN